MAIFGPFLASNHRTNVTVLPWQTLLPLARNVTRECVLEIGEQIALRRLVSEPDGFRMNAEWPRIAAIWLTVIGFPFRHSAQGPSSFDASAIASNRDSIRSAPASVNTSRISARRAAAGVSAFLLLPDSCTAACRALAGHGSPTASAIARSGLQLSLARS